MTTAREHFHLLGIGGTGMTALAGLLHESGCRVTGSDNALYPPTSTILTELGIQVHRGYDPSHLAPRPDRLVVGNALSRGNPELEAALDLGLPYASMPQIVSSRFLEGRYSMVVSGTHGKTTTSSMLASVLHRAGREPGFLIGGAPLDFDLPFAVGRGEEFVIEGDEYDTAFFDKGPKFMHYRPDTVLLGSVEYDHADIYPDVAAVELAFARLVNLIPRRGLLVCHQDSEVVRRVASRARCRVEGFGLDQGVWRAADIEEGQQGARFHVERDARPFFELQLRVSGTHNVLNALAVIAAATDRGLSAESVRAGLENFQGVRRRLEHRGEIDGVTVLDDFAHHPTAIAHTLEAVRRRFPGRRVWAVVEPRSWSMRRNVFQQRLAASFDPADRVVVARVYGAQAVDEDQRLDPHRLVADLAARGRRAEHLPDTASIPAHLAAETEPGDVVVVMSNGGFDGLIERFLDLLQKRRARAS